MKRVFKIFWMWDYEKEEKWLNDMSHQGWQLQRYTPFVYRFEQGEPDAYSDTASRVAHLDRMLTMIAVILFLLGYSGISFFLRGLKEGFSPLTIAVLTFYAVVVVYAGGGALGLLRKRKEMLADKM